MPNYTYTAKSFDGQTKTGTVFAESLHQLASSLKGENMLLIKAVLEGEKKKWEGKISLPFMGVKASEKIMMTRNLWIMFGAGLSLGKIFDILSTQAKNPKLKKIMEDIDVRINKGESFSDSLARYPDVFNDFFLSMVRIGEESGTLEEIFEILSIHMDRDHELKSKIRGALIYPCIILIVMGGIGVVISLFVLPKFSSFLLGMHVPLPIYTQILIGTSNLAQQFWYMTLIIPAVGAYLLFLAIKTKRGKRIADTILIRVPLLSPFIKKSNSAVMVRSLSSLNASGISLIRSLEITADTVGNYYFKQAILQAIERVKKGEKLSNALKVHAKLFPFGAIDMMEVGEETGKTSIVLKKLSEFYESEVIETTKNFSIIIEPMILIFLGGVVAFFAISIIEPMYSSLKSI